TPGEQEPEKLRDEQDERLHLAPRIRTRRDGEERGQADERHEPRVEFHELCRTPDAHGAQRFARLRGAAFLPEVFSATASRMSAFSARVSIFSPSWMSMARRTFPSRLELNRWEGSFSEAPLANVIFTWLL